MNLCNNCSTRGFQPGGGLCSPHLEPPYANSSSHTQFALSKQASDRSLLLPLFPSLTDQLQDEVVNALIRNVTGLSALPAGRDTP